jgi:SAM-dependent methyltransferase
VKLGGPKNIAVHVDEFINSHKADFTGKVVADIPAGLGRTSSTLVGVGAHVRSYDLFPDAFEVDGVNCEFADLTKPLPIETESCDIVIFQEGIEHLADQLFALSELNRILKDGGRLLLTTPNYSALRAKLAYLLLESEVRNIMPPNELESLWRPQRESKGKRIYFGHIFMIGIQKLRMLGWLAGFRIHKIHHTRVNWTSAILLPFFYPFIWLRNMLTAKRAMRLNTQYPDDLKRKTFTELRKLNCNPRILIEQHLFVELHKVQPTGEVKDRLYGDGERDAGTEAAASGPI